MENSKSIKKIIIIVAALLAAFISMQIFASRVEAGTASGTCGAGVDWTLNTSTGEMNISGSGSIEDYDGYASAPWHSYTTIIKKIIIAKGVTGIGKNAFANCSTASSVTIPESVTKIGSNAFFGCEALTKVNITDVAYWCKIEFENFFSNPLYYAHDLYLNGSRIKELVIPDGVTEISAYAFYTYRTPVIVLPSISFSGGTGTTTTEKVIASVTFPSSLTSIGDYAFYGRKGLETVTFSKNITSIGRSAFDNTKWYTGLSNGPVIVNGLLYKYKDAETVSITIPDEVTSVAGYAFEHCDSLTDITIGNNLETLKDNAFYNFTGTVHYYPECKVTQGNYGGTPTWKLISSVTIGDVNDDSAVDSDDAIYLLMHTIFPEDYPLNQDGDFNGDSMVDSDDAIYLLMYTIFPEDYPIGKKEDD